MPNINKVPASAGAEWLVNAFALLRRAPLGLGALGLIWGLLSLAVLQASMLNPTLGLALQLVLALLGPFLFAGLLWAVREVDQGRPARPAHLLKGLESGRGPSLLATLLPQVAAGLVLGVAFLVLVGQEQLQNLLEVTRKLEEIQQSGGQPDPQLMQGVPVGGIFLCLLLALVLAVAMVLLIFVSVPQIIFSGTSGLTAMRDSLRACLRNLPAMAVFLVLMFIALLAISFLVQLVALVAQLVLGQAAAIVAMNLLLMAVLMPLLAGVAYYAWKQMLRTSGADAPSAPLPPGHIEV